MKTILLLNNGYPSKTNPNYVAYIESIRQCLADAGFRVDLLVMNSNFSSKAGKYFQFLLYYLRILLFKSYKKYDYVYINNYPHSILPLIPRLGGIRQVVIHWHGDDILPSSGVSRFLNTLSYRYIRSNFIHFAPSAYFAKCVSDRLHIPIEQVHISPSGGVNTELFYPQPKHTHTSTRIRLGFASGLLQSKGIELVMQLLDEAAIRTANGTHEFELHYIAYGKEKDKYLPLLSRHSNTIRHAPMHGHQMPEFYNQLDLLLFPSLGDSLGLVALEAMACDVPVLASDSFAFPETVISGISGERFSTNDYASFLSALTTLIDQRNIYHPREFILKNFSQKTVAENYCRVLK